VPVLHVPTNPSLPATVKPGRNAGVGVESLAGKLSIHLASETNVQDGWEGVGEIEDEECADKTGDSVDVGNGGGDDEGDDPVEGTKAVPHPSSPRGGDFGELEDLLEHLNVDRLHSDVEVQHYWRG